MFWQWFLFPPPFEQGLFLRLQFWVLTFLIPNNDAHTEKHHSQYQPLQSSLQLVILEGEINFRKFSDFNIIHMLSDTCPPIFTKIKFTSQYNISKLPALQYSLPLKILIGHQFLNYCSLPLLLWYSCRVKLSRALNHTSHLIITFKMGVVLISHAHPNLEVFW